MKVLKWTTANYEAGKRELSDDDAVDVHGVSSLIVHSTDGAVLFVKDVIEFSVEEREA